MSNEQQSQRHEQTEGMAAVATEIQATLQADWPSGGAETGTTPIPIPIPTTPPTTTTPTAENLARETELRRSMLHIHNDETLTPREKAQRMQELMSGRYGLRRPPSRNSDMSPSSASPIRSPASSNPEEEDDAAELDALIITDEDREPSFHGRAGGERLLGCPHYRTNCKVRAECCSRWHPCRLCHDDAEDHPVDRHAIQYMLCLYCQTAQRCAKSCRACHKPMAHYFCKVCNLFDDDPTKEIYHCDWCRICRRGRREDFIHCDRCGGCLAAEHYGKHKCLEGSLQSSCPICHENMSASTLPVLFMPCGHAIHYLCHQEHTQNSYQCPICLKSLSNMTHFFQRIDEMMEAQQMPEEYSQTKSEILCNDCEKKSITKFHFVYHKCAHCNSYNTKLLRSFFEQGDAD